MTPLDVRKSLFAAVVMVGAGGLAVGCSGSTDDSAAATTDEGATETDDVANESDGEALAAGRLRFSCSQERLYAGHSTHTTRATMKAGDAFVMSPKKPWRDPRNGTMWAFGEWRPCVGRAQSGWIPQSGLSDNHGRCAHDPGVHAAVCKSGSNGGAAPTFSPGDAAVFDAAVTNGVFQSGVLAAMPPAARAELAATLAVSIDGKVVYTHAYGAATSPDQPFRLMSVSKPITAATVRALAAQGAFTLATAVYPYLGLTPLDSNPVTPGIDAITVENLLDHAGGWDRRVLDPMTNPQATSAVRQIVGHLPTSAEIARYMMTQPLQWTPGTHDISTDADAYANFGYALLGLVVEKATRGTVTGDASAYFDAVHAALPELGGVFQAHTLLADSSPQEPVYHAFDGNFAEPEGPSVIDGSPAAWPYGSGYIEPMMAHGGVVASASSIAHFLAGHWPSGFTELQRSGNAVYATGPRIGGTHANDGVCWSFAHTGLFSGTDTIAKQWDNHLAYVLLLNFSAPGFADAFWAPLDAAAKTVRGAMCR